MNLWITTVLNSTPSHYQTVETTIQSFSTRLNHNISKKKAPTIKEFRAEIPAHYRKSCTWKNPIDTDSVVENVIRKNNVVHSFANIRPLVSSTWKARRFWNDLDKKTFHLNAKTEWAFFHPTLPVANNRPLFQYLSASVVKPYTLPEAILQTLLVKPIKECYVRPLRLPLQCWACGFRRLLIRCRLSNIPDDKWNTHLRRGVVILVS